MTDNQKLQLWQAGILGNPDELQVPYNTLDYLNDDAAAMSLLDTLVEKGFCYYLTYTWPYKYRCIVVINNSEAIEIEYKPTRREAVCAAVLEMIRKEDV